MRLGVGIAGCGAVTQAIHLPALSALTDKFRVVNCMDPVAEVATEVARRSGARATTSLEDLLDDDAVQVVLIASPSALHAEQVIACCRAGRKAVLVEKPLAEDLAAAEAIAAASREHRVPVVVGTMHRYDPALAWLQRRWGDLPEEAYFVQSVCLAPPNPVMVGYSTQQFPPPPASTYTPPGPGDPRAIALVRGLMFGLAIHHLPLVRLALPGVDDVDVALPAGLGYEVSLRAGERRAQLTALIYNFVRTEWTFSLVGARSAARIEFGHTYLQSQSALARLWSADGIETRYRAPHTGYHEEWLHTWRVAQGEEPPLTSAESAIADTVLALQVAAAAEAGA